MIDGVSVTGEGFTVSGVSFPQTLEGGESLTLTVRFSPSEDGKKSGNVSLPSNAAGSPAQIALAGNGISSSASGQLRVNPIALDFGNVPTGNTETRDVVLSNSGGTALTVTQASVAGTNFTLSGLPLPLTLQVGETATFQGSFTPDTSGAVTGSISLLSDASNSPTTLSLTGNGIVLVGILNATPTSIDFGDAIVGVSEAQTVTLANSGTGDLNLSSAQVTGSAFSVSGLSTPLLLAAGQSISFNVTFSPSTAGAVTGSVSFLSDAVNSPTTLSLSGAGIEPVTHSVSLAWDASTSPNVSGHHVYRRTQSSGPYSPINLFLVLSTTFTDSSVLAGQTYFYVVTAVDANGVESIFSNEATAVVPSP